jgi:heterodisulfide reductase subunit C
MKRRTEITIETERLLVISRRNTSALAWCSDCGIQRQMMTPEAVARAASLSTRTVYRLIEAGDLHFNETSDHRLWVCVNSLNHLIETASQESISKSK